MQTPATQPHSGLHLASTSMEHSRLTVALPAKTYFGNNANFLLQRWNEYVNESDAQGGEFNLATNAVDNGFRYDNSLGTYPDFFAGVVWFAVSHAERVFIYEGLANGITGLANYDNVAPFFLNETFPDNWYPRGVPLALPVAFEQAAEMVFSEHPCAGWQPRRRQFRPARLVYEPEHSYSCPDWLLHLGKPSGCGSWAIGSYHIQQFRIVHWVHQG